MSSSTPSSEQLFPEELNILYDSKCNVYKLEMDFLARRDDSLAMEASHPRRIKLTDLEDESYNPNDPANGGGTYAEAMSPMFHACRQTRRPSSGRSCSLFSCLRFGRTGVARSVHRVANHQTHWMFAKYRTSVTRGTQFGIASGSL
jgi:hypothetical protein